MNKITTTFSKFFHYLTYGSLLIIALFFILAFALVITEQILHPEVVQAREEKRKQQMEGLLISDGCLDPTINKGFFDCPKSETSYKFKCTKNQKILTGVLCESGSSVYIRYDLNNFSQ